MKHKFSYLILLACALILVAPNVDAKQDKGKSTSAAKGPKIKHHGMDADGDGVITRSEWSGNDNSFRQHDRNGDGVLSGSELKPGAKKAKRDDDDDDRAAELEREKARQDKLAVRFQRWDSNRDGRISRSEWNGTSDAFNRLDTNRDGYLSNREFARYYEETGTLTRMVHGVKDFWNSLW